MPEDRLLPATAVRVRVYPPPTMAPSTSRISKGKRSGIVRGIAPFLIGAAVLALFLGGTGGILVVVAIALMATALLVAKQYRKSVSRRRYSSSPDDWMSGTAFYVSPFDRTGLPQTASFERFRRPGRQARGQAKGVTSRINRCLAQGCRGSPGCGSLSGACVVVDLERGSEQ